MTIIIMGTLVVTLHNRKEQVVMGLQESVILDLTKYFPHVLIDPGRIGDIPKRPQYRVLNNGEPLFVIPALAKFFMKFNTNNRNIKWGLVDRISFDLMGGSYVNECPSMIIVGEDGVLMDSQHRLEGIIRSGVGMWLIVVTNCHPSALIAIDNGLKRTLADAAHLHGIGRSHIAAALCGMIWRSEHGCIMSTQTRNISSTVCIETYEKYPQIQESIDYVIKNPWIRTKFTATFAAYARMLTQAMDPAHSDLFFERMRGVGVGEADPELALSTYCSNRRKLGTHTWRDTQVMLIALAKTWNAYYTGKVIAQVKIGANEELPKMIGEENVPWFKTGSAMSIFSEKSVVRPVDGAESPSNDAVVRSGSWVR